MRYYTQLKSINTKSILRCSQDAYNVSGSEKVEEAATSQEGAPSPLHRHGQ